MRKKTKPLHKNFREIRITPKFYLDLPDNPGVYLYFKNSLPIYVGKAVNLKNRVASYFRLDLEPKTKKMVSEANGLSYIKVTNELEALLLEAKLIKLYQPKYNIALKDDKHPLYIIITDEEFPRILTLRKTDLNKFESKSVYGPFPSTANVRSVLKIARRTFPYADHKIGKKPCLYSQLGQCWPCPNYVSNITDPLVKKRLTARYKSNIRKIKALLDGKIESLQSSLVKEMSNYSKSQKYEEAAYVRDQIKKMKYITSLQTPIDSYLSNPNLFEDTRSKELSELIKILKSNSINTSGLTRIECYDVAHLQGKSATASMVTFINGVSDKSLYRHFRIRQTHGKDDYESMREVARRRRKNIPNWGRPDLIVVDGGIGQMSIFLKEFQNEQVPVIGIAKRFETLVFPVKNGDIFETRNFKLPKGDALNLIQRIRDEAHRFARVYHHKLVSASLFENKDR